jgi:beta-galactosidase
MPVLDLIGAKIRFYDTLPAPNVAHVKAGDRTHEWFTWGDVLDPQPGTQTLATYADQYYAGGVAATTRPLGKGSVTYVGVDSVTGDLEAQLVGDVLRKAGARPEQFADGFSVDFRDGLWIATNFTEKSQPAPIPAGRQPVIGSRDVPIAGVTVWQE